MRALLRDLWENHGAPKLDAHITRYSSVRPRNVTVTDAERSAILTSAPPGMRLWILLCSDLALRSGTAVNLRSSDYDPAREELRFTTKKGARQTLPVTDEVGALLGTCDMQSGISFVRQLLLRGAKRNGRTNPHTLDASNIRRKWRGLLAEVGITRRIVPHDLRRTTAVGMLRATGDVREVQALLGHRNLQSTLWYLDHDLTRVSRATLELIKGNRNAQPRKETA